jgi:predicted membrane-bound spermidine synthase
MYFCLIGWLIVEYGLLPRALGVLILLGGLSWLTMLLPPLGNTLSPYNVGFGVLVRAALTVWLLAADVEVPSEIDEFAS